MRKLIVPAIIALLAVAPGAAFAATSVPTPAGEQTIAGTVKFFNSSAHSLELADGSWYYLPPTFKAPDLKTGDKVTVHWKMDGSAHDVTAIDIG
ncbi:DUF1344 domain-containing protein [Devosia sp. Root635]|uniref:DUF1344 domain-containing protein n=1 Tax=Devosia sp. Root635 TaxID=1736575 RepID=UPI0009EAC2DB|nr:DUF1344 domain-containing protein [Devosia sp. Root635]